MSFNGNNPSECVHLALPQQVPRLPAAGAAGLHPAVRECAGRAGEPLICGPVTRQFSDIVTPGFLYRWSCMGKL